VVVPVASPYRSFSDLIAAFREKPESISWAGGAVGGTEQMLALLIADAVGVDPKRVNYIASRGPANRTRPFWVARCRLGWGPC
jgi:putative tricarboxylic transport membrane protein